MSTSPSLSPSLPAPQVAAATAGLEALPFRYDEASGNILHRHLPGEPLSAGSDPAAASAAAATEREARARESARQQGEAQARAGFEEQLGRERAGIAAAISQFACERAAYYQKLEEEVVKLSLGIARQILHREAQVDPLLLMGIVRVALERIEGATGVELVVHPQNSSDWRRFLASRMEPAELPEIVEDPAMPADRCAIRTSMGTTELGLEVQLKEIEHGLMDLLAARPKESL